MNWYDVVPDYVAESQIAWELRQRILYARNSASGTQEKVAKFLGVSRITIAKYERIAVAKRIDPPIQLYLNYPLNKMGQIDNKTKWERYLRKRHILSYDRENFFWMYDRIRP